MKVLIDADGCPVVDITLRVTKQYKLECVILCDTSHIFEKQGATIITVSKGADSVDFALVNMVHKGDIVITQDYGLAAMCLAKGAVTINQNGKIYDNDNIDFLLNERHIAKKARMSKNNKVKFKSIPKRTKQQDLDFERKLVELLTVNNLTS